MTAATPAVVETTKELAARWKVSERQIGNLLHQGLPSRKIGRSRRFIAAEVDAWLLQRGEAA